MPDNLLWYLPFEALIPAGGKGDKTFADLIPIRYGPTAALAVSNPRPLRRPQHTGILAGDMKFAGEQADRDKLLQELVSAVAGPLVLPEPLNEPARLVSPLLDGLVVLDDIQGDTLGEPSYLFPKSAARARKKPTPGSRSPTADPSGSSSPASRPKPSKVSRLRAARHRARAPLARPAAAPGDDIFHIALQPHVERRAVDSADSLADRRPHEFRSGPRIRQRIGRRPRRRSLATGVPARARTRSIKPTSRDSNAPKKRATCRPPTTRSSGPATCVVDTGPRPRNPRIRKLRKRMQQTTKNCRRQRNPGEAGDKLPPPKTEKEPAADKKAENAAAEGAAPPKNEEPKTDLPK